MTLSDPVAAEKEFRIARALGADRVAVNVQIGRAMLAQNKNADILSQLPQTGPTAEETARLLYIRALAQVGLNDRAAADATLASARKIAPGAIETLLVAAQVTAVRGDQAKTEAAVDDVLRRDPNQIDAILIKQQIAVARDNHPEALDLAERATKIAPYSIVARLRHAVELIYADRDDDARADIGTVLSIQPRSVEATYLAGVLLARAARYSAAAVEFEKFDGVMDKFPIILYYRALVVGNLGQAEAALAYAVRYNTVKPNDPSGIRLVARSYLGARAPKDAIPILERATSGGSADADMFDLLGAAYNAVGNSPAAIAAFAAASKLAPTDTGIMTHLRIVQMQSGRYPGSACALACFIEVSPFQQAPIEARVTAAIAEGDPTKAESALSQLRDHAAKTEYVGLLTGAVKLLKRDLDGAQRAFADVQKRYPASLAAKLSMARVQVLQGNLADGTALMTEVLAKDPANVAALNAFLKLAVENRQVGRVSRVLSAASNAFPRQAEFTAALTDALVLSGSADKALNILATGPYKGSLPPILKASLARAQAASGMVGDARATFRDVLSVTPDDVVDRMALTDLLINQHDYDAARQELQAGLAWTPGNFAMMTKLVELEVRASGLDSALTLADKMAADPAHGPLASLLRGDALMRAKRPDAAAQSFLAVYENDAAVPPLLRAAEAYVAGGDDEKAARLLRDWLEKAPNTPAVLDALSKIDIRASRLKMAQSRLEALVALLPTEPTALNNLAWTYQQLGDKRARATAQRAYLLAPSPDSADTLGWILLKEGELAAALPLLQQAADNPHPDQSIQFHLATALHMQGRYPDAIALLKTALSQPEPFADRPAAETLLRDLQR